MRLTAHRQSWNDSKRLFQPLLEPRFESDTYHNKRNSLSVFNPSQPLRLLPKHRPQRRSHLHGGPLVRSRIMTLLKVPLQQEITSILIWQRHQHPRTQGHTRLINLNRGLPSQDLIHLRLQTLVAVNVRYTLIGDQRDIIVATEILSVLRKHGTETRGAKETTCWFALRVPFEFRSWLRFGGSSGIYGRRNADYA